MEKSKKKETEIYLDYMASADVNPSSMHNSGINAKRSLEKARAEVAAMLRAAPAEIIFTSGGTESNNLAIQGVVSAWAGESLPHIVTTNIEHPSVLETCRMLERNGVARVSIVPVERTGIIDPKKIKKAIKKNTVLISVMYVNNEIGTIQPIKEIAKAIRHFRKTRGENFFQAPASQRRRSKTLLCHVKINEIKNFRKYRFKK